VDDLFPVLLFDFSGLTIEDQTDPVTNEGPLYDFRRVGVLPIQDMRGIMKENHFRTQPSKGLRQLASDGPRR